MKLLITRLLRWMLGPQFFQDNPFFGRLRHRVNMAYLRETDIIEHRVERLRELGAKVGRNCRFFPVHIFSEPNLVDIGDNVIISGQVTLLTHDGAIHAFAKEIPNVNGHFGRISIGNNCFIGFGAIIMPNVSIGNNCIVAAGAVVFESFPDDCVIIGNPARVAFKTSLYLAMKRESPNTIIDERYPFPAHYPRDLLDERIGSLPIRPPRGAPRPKRPSIERDEPEGALK